MLQLCYYNVVKSYINNVDKSFSLCYTESVMKKCIDCYFWDSTGTEPYQGYCRLGSADCITAIFNHRPATRFLDKNVELISKPMKGGKGETKGRIAFMTNEDMVKAHQNKQRQNPTYPDTRILTDESKEMLRKERRKK